MKITEAEDNVDGSDTEGDTVNNPTNFTRLANNLIDAANEDDKDDDDSDDELASSSFFVPCHRLNCYFRGQELIPLGQLFHFQKPGSSDDKTPSREKGKDLDYYWKDAIKNLDKELELYELLQDVESTREDEAGHEGTNDSPIEVEQWPEWPCRVIN